jgi:hypothetical protein
MNENTGPLDFQGKVVQVGDYLIFVVDSLEPELGYAKVLKVKGGHILLVVDCNGALEVVLHPEKRVLVVPYLLPRSVKRALDQHTNNAED